MKKSELHPRNLHNQGYHFEELITVLPELGQFMAPNKMGIMSVDFSSPEAVKALNKALLKKYYQINYWEIPPHYLCPPIPGRADYLHYLADLLSQSYQGKLPPGKSIRVLDIGVGSNLIYPIIGVASYGWHFLGSDIDVTSLTSAQKIIDLNAFLTQAVELRLQKNKSFIFQSLLKKEEVFDLTMCNPPFHASMDEAMAGNKRKWKNLKTRPAGTPLLNFGGQENELWYPGGEIAFLQKYIQESLIISKQCYWFTSLVSKESNLPMVYHTLEKGHATMVRTIDMAQGQKKSRLVAWTFLSAAEQIDWQKKRWQK